MKASKTFALTLAAVMAASALASCGGSSSSSSSSSSTGSTSTGGSSSTGSTSTADTSPLSFRVTTVNFGASPEGKEIQEAWLDLCSELMGREIQPQYEFINMGDYSEKLKIICAGGDIPDLLSWGWGTQADLIKWGEEGLFEELTQHMDSLPNYASRVAADQRAQYTIYSTDSKLYAFYGATYQGDYPTVYSNGNAAAIRKDVLDGLGLAIPETLDEFYDVAVALKQAYPDVYPMILHEEWQAPESLVYSAKHTSNGRYYNAEAGSYVYGPTTDNYKDALMELNKWYTNGLISPDYFTHTSENGTAAVSSGTAFLIPSAWEGYPGNWKTQYPDQEWVLVPTIKDEAYGDPWTFYATNPSEWQMTVSYGVVVSSSSKVKDEMLRLMDLQYSDEVVDLVCWGIEDETYTINADGEKHFTDEFLADQANWSEIAFGQGSCRAAIFPTAQSRVASQDSAITEEIYYNGEIHDQSWDQFVSDYETDANTDPTTLIINLPLTSDQSEEYANIMTPVNTFAEEQRVKFIKGERSFDEWDKYLEELNAMGDIQAAMDIYNANVVK